MNIANFFDLGFREAPLPDVVVVFGDTQQSNQSDEDVMDPSFDDYFEDMAVAPQRKSRKKLILYSSLIALIVIFGLIYIDSNFHGINPSVQNTGPNDPTYHANGYETPKFNSPFILAFAALFGLALVLGVLAFFLHFLRQFANPLHWQISCWFLVSVGILLRPFVVSGEDPLQTSIKGAIVAGIISLSVFPVFMRLLNSLKTEPGLIHVALPFALGFFLDVAQLLAKTYVPGLEWLK